jgi:MFS family permease
MAIKRERRKLVVLYMFFRAITTLATSLAAAFMTIYYLQFFSASEYSLVFAVTTLLAILLEYPSGILTSLVGERNIMIATYSIYAVCFIGYAVVTSPIELFLLELLCTVGNALYSGTLATWLVNTYQKNDQALKSFKQDLGIINSFAIVLGAGLGYLGGFIADVLTLETVFLVQCVFSVLCATLFLLYMKPTVKKDKEQSLASFSTYHIEKIFHNKQLLRLIVLYGTSYTAYMIFYRFLWQPFIKSAGATYATMGFYYLLGMVAMAVTNLVTTKYFTISTRLWEYNLLFIIPISIVLSGINDVLLLGLSLIAYMFLVGFIFPHIDFYIHKEASEKNRSSIMGVREMFSNTSQTLSMVVVGVLFTVSDYSVILFVVLLLVISSYVIVRFDPIADTIKGICPECGKPFTVSYTEKEKNATLENHLLQKFVRHEGHSVLVVIDLEKGVIDNSFLFEPKQPVIHSKQEMEMKNV